MSSDDESDFISDLQPLIFVQTGLTQHWVTAQLSWENIEPWPDNFEIEEVEQKGVASR